MYVCIYIYIYIYMGLGVRDRVFGGGSRRGSRQRPCRHPRTRTRSRALLVHAHTCIYILFHYRCIYIYMRVCVYGPRTAKPQPRALYPKSQIVKAGWRGWKCWRCLASRGAQLPTAAGSFSGYLTFETRDSKPRTRNLEAETLDPKTETGVWRRA